MHVFKDRHIVTHRFVVLNRKLLGQRNPGNLRSIGLHHTPKHFKEILLLLIVFQDIAT